MKKIEEEPEDQYGIEAFKKLFWSDAVHESIADNPEKSKNYRKETYCALNDIDITKLKELSEIIILSNAQQNYLTPLENLDVLSTL